MLVLCNFSTKIDGFEQKDSQGFENSYNSYEQYPLEKFFIFTIYQKLYFGFNPSEHHLYTTHIKVQQFFNSSLHNAKQCL